MARPGLCAGLILAVHLAPPEAQEEAWGLKKYSLPDSSPSVFPPTPSRNRNSVSRAGFGLVRVNFQTESCAFLALTPSLGRRFQSPWSSHPLPQGVGPARDSPGQPEQGPGLLNREGCVRRARELRAVPFQTPASRRWSWSEVLVWS